MDRGTSDNGFSIIEMLVALGIAAALIVVGVTVYVGSEKTAETVDALETLLSLIVLERWMATRRVRWLIALVGVEVGLEGGAHGGDVADHECCDDRVVVGAGAGAVAPLPGGEVAGAPESGEEGVMRLGEGVVVRRIGDGGVEGHVHLEEVERIPGLVEIRHLVAEVVDAGEIVFRRAAACELRREHLKGPQDQELVGEFLERGIRDPGAPRRREDDQPFGGQDADRLAHGCPADPQPFGVVAFLDLRAGEQLPAQDVASKPSGDLRCQVRIHHRGGSSGARSAPHHLVYQN